MATFTATAAVDIQSGIPLLEIFTDAVHSPNPLLFISSFSDKTATGFKYSVDANNYILVTGSNFSYFFGFVPNVGTIDTIQVYGNGALSYTLTGIDITLNFSLTANDVTNPMGAFNAWVAQANAQYDIFALRDHTVNGSTFSDHLAGLQGNDTIGGNGGTDLMYGLGGNDTYYVNDATDAAFETAGQGTDRIFTSVSYGLNNTSEVEDLYALGMAGAINLTGNKFANKLFGNDAANTLDGRGGNDELNGAGGNDFYFVDSAGDVVNEAAGGGNDRIFANVSYALKAGSEVETVTTMDNGGTAAINLTGNAFVNTIYGNAGANTLNGLGGDDTLSGFGGNDFYYVDSAGDVVNESAGGGTDRVFAAVSYTLRAGSEVETLTTADNAGIAAINLAGNELANTIFGNAGANMLDGKGGADSLNGVGGDDVYVVDNAADVVSESVGGGYDQVITSVSYALKSGSEVEKLLTNDVLSIAPLNLTGNGFDNYVLGNLGPNILDGGGGNDIMHGVAGHDMYFVDSAGDVVIEVIGAGNDRVFASLSYTLTVGSEIEKLSTMDNGAVMPIDFNGNEFDNTIFGNAGANVLNGKLGNDSPVGLGGADTFRFDTALDPVGNVDYLSDFSPADDTIALENAIFTGLPAIGPLSAAAFRVGTGAGEADDRIIYDDLTGALLYDPDGLGGAGAIQFALVKAGVALTSADFVVT